MGDCICEICGESHEFPMPDKCEETAATIASLQERNAELEKERDLMLFKAKVQFNVFWNGGWY
jgi:hypothetical protein